MCFANFGSAYLEPHLADLDDPGVHPTLLFTRSTIGVRPDPEIPGLVQVAAVLPVWPDFGGTQQEPHRVVLSELGVYQGLLIKGNTVLNSHHQSDQTALLCPAKTVPNGLAVCTAHIWSCTGLLVTSLGSIRR